MRESDYKEEAVNMVNPNPGRSMDNCVARAKDSPPDDV